MNWASPRRGLRSNGAWVNPVLTYREKVKPANGKYRFLFPFVAAKWEVGPNKPGSSGVVAASLSMLERQLGSIRKITLRSARNWFATYAKQLSLTKEDRATLGRWKPGSNMPDRYDRSVCATELALRRKIVCRIEKGRRRASPYEIPKNEGRTQPDLAESSAESTSESSTTSELVRQLENIADLYGATPPKRETTNSRIMAFGKSLVCIERWKASPNARLLVILLYFCVSAKLILPGDYSSLGVVTRWGGILV